MQVLVGERVGKCRADRVEVQTRHSFVGGRIVLLDDEGLGWDWDWDWDS